jgi:hypothetical protein
MTESTHIVCSTSNCDNRATVKVADTSEPMLVCGECHHAMMMVETVTTMDEADRAAARQLVKDWCAPKMPKGWEMREPGYIVFVGEAHGSFEYWVDVRDRYLRALASTGRVPVEIVDIALRSTIAGMAPALAGALTSALDDGDCLRGVIARAIDASNNIADRDAEDAIQEMLSILLEPEPEGHDDRIEWARMEGANAMLEVIQREGYGARGIVDNRDSLRRMAAELAVATTMPRNPEPEFENALLQREVEQLRLQLDNALRERDVTRREADQLRFRVEVDENDLDEAGFFDDDGVRLTDPHPKIVAWMAANGFEFVDPDRQDERERGIWRGPILVRRGTPRADEGVVNDLALAVNRPPLDVLAEIAAMVIK